MLPLLLLLNQVTLTFTRKWAVLRHCFPGFVERSCSMCQGSRSPFFLVSSSLWQYELPNTLETNINWQSKVYKFRWAFSWHRSKAGNTRYITVKSETIIHLHSVQISIYCCPLFVLGMSTCLLYLASFSVLMPISHCSLVLCGGSVCLLYVPVLLRDEGSSSWKEGCSTVHLTPTPQHIEECLEHNSSSIIFVKEEGRKERGKKGGRKGGRERGICLG